MKIRLAVEQFFRTRPDPERVQPLGIDPKVAEILGIRPPFSKEGVTFFLMVSPSRKAFFNALVSQLIFFEVRQKDKEIYKKLLSMLIFDSRNFSEIQLEVAFQLLQSDLKKDRTSQIELSAKLKRYLAFVPSKGIAENRVIVDCLRGWLFPKKIVYPQRKRGYDDKGSLAPQGSIPWQEIAQSVPTETSTKMATLGSISNFVHSYRVSGLDEPPDESLKDENPLINLLRRYSK